MAQLRQLRQYRANALSPVNFTKDHSYAEKGIFQAGLVIAWFWQVQENFNEALESVRASAIFPKEPAMTHEVAVTV
jgi:hypothetical protein